MSAEPAVPPVRLDRVEPLRFQFYDHTVGAYLVTADDAMTRWADTFCSAAPRVVGVDIEARGLDEAKFSITCVTVAMPIGEDIVALLLDPLRRPEHRGILARVFDHASDLIFHGASFDIAPLYAHRLMTRAHIRKVGDTLVVSRMMNTYAKAGRALENLATAYRVMDDDRLDMKEVFAARGLKKDEGYHYTDIDTPTYVVGAMADRVPSLLLWGNPDLNGSGIVANATRYLTSKDMGLGGLGKLYGDAAGQVVHNVLEVNRIVLERTARGYAVDREFRDRFVAAHEEKWLAAANTLTSAGIRPGNGLDLVTALVRRGVIDESIWPRTGKGQLKADKQALEIFDHMDASRSELVAAHQTVATSEKIFGYLNKVMQNSVPTGRLHPEIKILGASATGRMSASMPEVQQFPKEARGIILSDGEFEWISADWKSIEPVILATAAGDGAFLAEMRAGADPYEPVGERTGIGRKPAKRLMLANMYGLGYKSAALQYGWKESRAKEVLNQLRESLPILYKLIDEIKKESRSSGHVTTLSGRVVDQRFSYYDDDGMLRNEVASRIAANHFCQGSALDVMHQSILELDKRGLSDHVHLWMHDEIVADKEIEAELTEVMSTPPPFLEAAAHQRGIEPFLAVDVNSMGHRWEYV